MSKDKTNASGKNALTGDIEAGDYRRRLLLSRLMGALLHRSSGMDRGDSTYFQECGMQLGNEGYVLVAFTIDHGLSVLRLSPYKLYEKLEKTVRLEFMCFTSSYCAELDGRVFALIYITRRELENGGNIIEHITGCCRRLLYDAIENCGIMARADISALHMGWQNIETAYREVMEMIRYSEFWHEKKRPDIMYSGPRIDDHHFATIEMLISSSEKFCGAASRGDKESAVGEAVSVLNSVRTAKPFSVSRVITDARVFFDLILHEMNRLNILHPGNSEIAKRSKAFASVKCMRELEMTVLETAEFCFERYVKNRGREASRRVRAAHIFIAEKISDPELSASIVADNFSVSQPLMSAQFKKYNGVTISDHISRLRVQKAMELLKSTGMKLPEICEETGFGSITTMHRQFKRYCGMSPGRYRRDKTGK